MKLLRQNQKNIKLNHHKNTELTVETNPTRFLDTAFNVSPDGSVTTKVFRKPGNFQLFGTLKYLKVQEE